MEFQEYLAESSKEYKYTLKLAVESVGDGMLDALETALERYELVSAGAFKETPIQESPLDFPNVKNSPVFISEIVMRYPASRDFLKTFIGNALALSEQLICVYSENDPRGLETALHLERSAPEFAENYKPHLGDDDYSEHSVPDDLSPDDQRMTLLKELDTDRVEKVVDIIAVAAPATDGQGHDDTFNDGLPAETPSLFGRIKPTTLRLS